MTVRTFNLYLCCHWDHHFLLDYLLHFYQLLYVDWLLYFYYLRNDYFFLDWNLNYFLHLYFLNDFDRDSNLNNFFNNLGYLWFIFWNELRQFSLNYFEILLKSHKFWLFMRSSGRLMLDIKFVSNSVNGFRIGLNNSM